MRGPRRDGTGSSGVASVPWSIGGIGPDGRRSTWGIGCLDERCCAAGRGRRRGPPSSEGRSGASSHWPTAHLAQAPNWRDLRADPGPARRPGSPLAAGQASSTGRSTTPSSRPSLDDGTVLPGPSRRHGGLPRSERERGAGPQPRDQRPRCPRSATRRAVRRAWPASGTTTVEVTLDGEVVDAFTSLNGTQMNCSGGVMPWGSWITCEETVNGPDVGPDFTGVVQHPADSSATASSSRCRQAASPTGSRSRVAGRFAHEAAAFDPRHGHLYLTEDNFGFPSGLYRYIPPSNPMDDGPPRGRRPAADAGGHGRAQRRSGRHAAGTTRGIA